nr:putative reverse transcriptase domain-containing protein [Tanacetum cinerariifolium]
MNCLHFNVRRLLDFVDVFGRQCVVMILFLVAPYVSALAGCDRLVVRISLKGDEILRVHGERTQGVVKTLMNPTVCKPYLDKFVIVFINDILIYSKMKKEHEVHLKSVFSWSRGQPRIHVDPSKSEAVRNQMIILRIGRDWDSSLTGLELVHEMTDKVVLVKEKPKAARDRQKSCVDYGHKPLEFEHRLERTGLITSRLRLPEELNSVHDTFHVSNLKRCLEDANLHVPLDEIKADKTLHFVEEPVEIMD